MEFLSSAKPLSERSFAHGSRRTSVRYAEADERDCGCSAPLPPSYQAKLSIGAVDDPLEYEADRVADQVMRMPDPNVSITQTEPSIRRKCEACEATDDGPRKLRMKPAERSNSAIAEPLSSVAAVLRSPGWPLNAASRAFFEPRFKTDLSHIRIHTDPLAAGSAHSIRAQAYTVGNHLVFGTGRYAFETSGGRRLLAHELTHSLQQLGSSGTRQGTAARFIQRTPEDSSHELTEQDEKTCSPLYLQKLCVEIIGGFNGDRSGVETAEEMATFNKTCRLESGYTGPDVELSTKERLDLRSPKCPRGDPEQARRRERAARIASAIDRSMKYIPGGGSEELARMVQDPIFIGSVALAIGAYFLLWLAPEPLFTKIAAAATTIAILSTTVFSVSTILNLAQAWLDLDQEAGAAQSDDQIERAAEHFGKRIGAVGADLLVFLAALFVGGKLPGPKSAPPAGAAIADAERALASAKPGGTVIQGPWGRASTVVPGEPPVGATSGNLALKVEFFPAPEAPPPVAEPVPKAAAPTPAKPTSPAQGPRTPPAIAVAPGVGSKEKPGESNSMRHQIQRGAGHYSSKSVTANARDGVTAQQLRATMSQNFDQYMRIARNEQPLPKEWTRGPVAWEQPLRSAIVRQSQLITTVVASGGVLKAGDINALRQCFDAGTLAASNCAPDDVRLDIENKGHNLKS